ncbi:MAG: lipopolysaccharide biosynthesis protein [Gammaproteobacteria bacterium]
MESGVLQDGSGIAMEVGSLQRLMHAMKWSMGAEVASKVIQPLVFVILARLLSPEDFGVMAAALMVISFSQVFWESGMGKALIQRQGKIDKAANAAFWLNIVLGISVAAILFYSAAGIADVFFHDDRVAGILQVMTLQVLLGALASVHVALLQKDMRFNHLFWVRFATVSLPGLVSIPLAWGGMGYWALVAGTLLGQAAQVLVLWRISGWRPRFEFDRAVAVDLARFGVWVSLSGLLAWFYIWADSLVVGMYLGAHDLGLYRTGNQFVILVYSLVFAPLLPVLYSHFSVIQHDTQRLNRALARVMRLIALIAIPVAFLLFVLSEPLAAVLFGEKWTGIGFVVGVLALAHGYAWLVGVSGEIYRAVGKPKYESVAMLLSFAVYFPAYLVAIESGFTEFVWTRFLLVAWGIGLHLYFLNKVAMKSVWGSAVFAVKITLASTPLLLPAMFPELMASTDNTVIRIVAVAAVLALVFAMLRYFAREEYLYLLGLAGMHRTGEREIDSR